jgi:hypothetical protein
MTARNPAQPPDLVGWVLNPPAGTLRERNAWVKNPPYRPSPVAASREEKE